MDFSSQLANLQRTAANAASRQQQNTSSNREHDLQHRYDEHRHHAGRKRPRRGGGGFHQNSNAGERRGRHYWNEHALERALATLPHFRLPSQQQANEPPPAPTKTQYHIALLAITIDDLPYEHFWKAWASEEGESSRVSLLCHAKFPRRVQSEWLKQRLLVDPPVMGRGHEYQAPTYHSRKPEWGSIEITRAMLDLLHEGLKIGHSDDETSDARFSTRRYAMDRNTSEEILASPLPPVDKFIFISETCIPIATLEKVQKALFGGGSDDSDAHNNDMQEHMSWVNARNTPNNGYSKQLQFDKIHPVVPRGCLWKADQWMVLSRAHATAIMEIDRHLPRDHFLWECFQDTKASDELYFPTALGLLGVLPSSPTVKLRRITYADWSMSARNPASFAKGVQDLSRVAELARAEGCLLVRKFELWDAADKSKSDGISKEEAPGYISVEDWWSVVHATSSSAQEESKKEAASKNG